MKYDVVVIGAGIVGLAHALAAAKRGLSVALIERSDLAVGASVRNFGLVWPIGQPAGVRHERALRTRAIWGEVAGEAGIYLAPSGSLHLAYHPDEWAVLEEFNASRLCSDHGRRLMAADEVAARCPAVESHGLLGGLWSPTEATVDPREAIRKLPLWLATRFGVHLAFATWAHGVMPGCVQTTRGEFKADRILVCSGPDFETLYPEFFRTAEIIRCKLQMLRTKAQPPSWSLGPALCAGLTLTHYESFRDCPSLGQLRRRFEVELPFCVDHGIHVLASETPAHELTLGDSHAYDNTVDPFDREDVNQAILAYLRSFVRVPQLEIAERWHGVYAKMTNGASELVLTPAPSVTVVNGLGGSGMSMSFGLAEEVFASFG